MIYLKNLWVQSENYILNLRNIHLELSGLGWKHQIAFHVEHPHNSHILIEALGQRSSKHFPWFLYRGSRIEELVTRGLELEPCAWGSDPKSLELVAWPLELEA